MMPQDQHGKAEDRAALVENIYDLAMVVNHADSLVVRIERHIGRFGADLPYHTETEAEKAAERLSAIAYRLLHAVRQTRPERQAER